MNASASSQDILRRFPYEVWSKCILDAIYCAPEGPLFLLNVAPHWQTLLLDSPEMWSYIRVKNDEDVAAKFHIVLHLSRQFTPTQSHGSAGSIFLIEIYIILFNKPVYITIIMNTLISIQN
jgi:hypothetical protein